MYFIVGVFILWLQTEAKDTFAHTINICDGVRAWLNYVTYE